VSEIPPAAWDLLQGLDTLVLDAVRRRPHPNHFHFQKAKEIAAELGAKKTIFTHLSHDYDHDKTEAEELPPEIRLAYDGMKILVEA
jgi:phosphoribosyl 1,2-cyclic phosphate phosphodiesterase